MVDAVSHCIHQVLAEVVGAGAVVLHEMETRLLTVFVIPVQSGPLRQQIRIATDTGIHRAQVFSSDPAITVGIG